MASEDDEVLLDTEDQSGEKQEKATLPSRKKTSESDDKAEKTSISANGGEGFLNGNLLYFVTAWHHG